MTCADFLDRFSDYYDGLVQPSDAALFDEHKGVCPTCARYADVLDQSLGLLRELPTLDMPESFEAGVRYRIQHEDELALVGMGPLGSAAATRAIAFVALVLAFTAWAPTLATRPSADASFANDGLLPVASVEPEDDAAGYDDLELAPFATGQLSAPDDDVRQLWSYPNAMLYEYSALGDRNRWRAEEDSFVRAVGLE